MSEQARNRPQTLRKDKEELSEQAREVTIERRLQDADLSDAQLIARIKHDHPGEGVKTLYGSFVKARRLQPSIGAGEFARLLESATPDAHVRKHTRAFEPTHTLRATGELAQVWQGERGMWYHVTENGSTGSTPPQYFEMTFEPMDNPCMP